MDPVTVIVLAIASGVAAGAKDTAAAMVRDAYAAVSGLIARRYGGVDLGPVERRPGSEAKRASLHEDLEAAGGGQDQELLDAATALVGALRAADADPAEVIGVDLAQVEAAALSVGAVSSTGTGVRVRDSTFRGDVTIGTVRAGGRGAPRPR